MQGVRCVSASRVKGLVERSRAPGRCAVTLRAACFDHELRRPAGQWSPRCSSPAVDCASRRGEAGGPPSWTQQPAPAWPRWPCSLSPLPPSAVLTRSPDSPWPCWPRAFPTCSSLCQKHFSSVHTPGPPHTHYRKLKPANRSESFRLQFRPVSLRGPGRKMALGHPSLPYSPPTQVLLAPDPRPGLPLGACSPRAAHSSQLGYGASAHSVAVVLAGVCAGLSSPSLLSVRAATA